MADSPCLFVIAHRASPAGPLVDVGRIRVWRRSRLAREDDALWVGHRGGTGDEPPTPEQMDQWRRRMAPPENEFPAGVGLTVLLGRTDDAAVGITLIEAFSTGFRFTLAVRLRQAPPELARGGLGDHLLPSGAVVRRLRSCRRGQVTQSSRAGPMICHSDRR